MKRRLGFQRHLWICVSLAVFNVVDALLTHRVLLGGGTELNPIMAVLYNLDPALFLFVKFIFSYLILIVGFVSLRRSVQVLLYVAFTAYSFVIGWHLILQLSI